MSEKVWKSKSRIQAIGLLLACLCSVDAFAVDYTYDSLGRLTNITYANGASIDYQYDPVSNILTTTTTAEIDTDGDGTPDSIDADDDDDGLPDDFEIANELDPLDDTDASRDEDSDGLSNLEEYQHNTDINNPDSDGDGTHDGDEVATGRNPLVNEPVILIFTNYILDLF